MAWRIDEQVLRGEIDNRTPGRVIGKIWLLGRDEPMELDLVGNPCRDLAGHVLRFTNPDPQPGGKVGLASRQVGVVGDMTASRKVKIPDCSTDKLLNFFAGDEKSPWHWGNALSLEWFTQTNGRVVIDAPHYQLEMDTEPAWIFTEADEIARQAANEGVMTKFMQGIAMTMIQSQALDDDDDHPQSREEAQADAEDARMQLLMNRVTARLRRGEFPIEEYDRIYEEERARLIRERGEKDPEFTRELLEERQQWIDEMNAIAEEALIDLEAEKWQGPEREDEPRHPLVVACSDLAVALHYEIHNAGWLAQDAHQEHPLWEIQNGVSFASAKLAGALGMASRYDEWPPDFATAADVIVRLKKARAYLRDALNGLDSTDEETLATPQWRYQTRMKVIDLLGQTQVLLCEARAVLELPPDDGDLGIF